MDTHFQKPAEPWEKTEGSVVHTLLYSVHIRKFCISKSINVLSQL